jgi:hypothetical protein
MRTLFWFIVLVVLSFAILYSTDAEAGGPWSDQYCDVETTTIRVVDQNGKVINEYTEEVVHCEDGVKDFLHGMGIASECKFFNWDMPLKNSMVTERSIACKRMDGGHEIVPGYHNID